MACDSVDHVFFSETCSCWLLGQHICPVSSYFAGCSFSQYVFLSHFFKDNLNMKKKNKPQDRTILLNNIKWDKYL